MNLYHASLLWHYSQTQSLPDLIVQARAAMCSAASTEASASRMQLFSLYRCLVLAMTLKKSQPANQSVFDTNLAAMHVQSIVIA